MPANAGLFFGVLMNIASFDLLPTDKFYDAYFDLKEEDDGAVDDNFESIGYGSTLFLYNMGTLMLSLMIIPILIGISLLLKALSHFFS